MYSVRVYATSTRERIHSVYCEKSAQETPRREEISDRVSSTVHVLPHRPARPREDPPPVGAHVVGATREEIPENHARTQERFSALTPLPAGAGPQDNDVDDPRRAFDTSKQRPIPDSKSLSTDERSNALHHCREINVVFDYDPPRGAAAFRSMGYAWR